jgi:hypothetical protein
MNEMVRMSQSFDQKALSDSFRARLDRYMERMTGAF